MKTLIHVNQHTIRHNAKNEADEAPIIVRTRSNVIGYAHEVEVKGPGKFIYAGEQLSCGARLWYETDAEVNLIRRSPKPRPVA